MMLASSAAALSFSFGLQQPPSALSLHRSPPPAMMGKATMMRRAASKTNPKKKTKATRKAKAKAAAPESPAAVASGYDNEDFTGVVVPTPTATPEQESTPEPAAALESTREVAWFPSSAPDMAPPVFDAFPNLSVLGVKPGDRAPAYLNGKMIGDMGLDPLCLVALARPKALTDIADGPWSTVERKAKFEAMSAEEQKLSLSWMREAELKHARLAMLAAAGWPLAELVQWKRNPSLFNGHLFEPKFLLPVLLFFGAFGFLETLTSGMVANPALVKEEDHVEGNLGFDPLGLYGEQGLKMGPISRTREELRLAEIKNGRAAMLAITGFSVQEFIQGSAVVKQTPLFFGPAAFGRP